MMWWENSKVLRLKPDKVIIKLHNEDGSFNEAINIPTEYWPLNGAYQVFVKDCTIPIVDEKAIELFDSVEYRIGRCYTNTKNLEEAFQGAGYDFTPYFGWLFLDNKDYPTAHCWGVLTTEKGRSIIDLSDDLTVMDMNRDIFESAKDQEEMRHMIADFQIAARQQPNSIRCQTVGVPTGYMLYIGSPCEPEIGRQIFEGLMKKYPDHKTNRGNNREGLSRAQEVMKNKGLI